jgi:hypothetical protein
MLDTHEYTLFYSIIANLLKIIDDYEAAIPESERKLEMLPDNVYDWVVSFMEEANEVDDEHFQKLVDYFEESLDKKTDFHKRTN